jgi:hypothetical protein
MVTIQTTPLLEYTSFLPHYLTQSDCLAADHQGQGDTRLTLTPSVIPKSNCYHGKGLKPFKILLRVFYRAFLITLYNFTALHLCLGIPRFFSKCSCKTAACFLFSSTPNFPMEVRVAFPHGSILPPHAAGRSGITVVTQY